MTTFPEGFLWGLATAGHQVEGNNTNSDVWFLENLPETIFREPSGDACDHYNRYREDIALIASLGFNSYRFSLEWARIEPSPGQFDLDELDHYADVMRCCREHGLASVVTFHHFVSPLWLLARGGWESPETPALFARYCRTVMEHLGDLVDVACTLNEPNLPFLLKALGLTGEPAEARVHVPVWREAAAALGVEAATIAPFQFTASAAGYDCKLAAHRAGREAIKAVRPDLPVGWTLANSDIQSVPGGEQRAAAVWHEVNERFLEASRGDDFVGIQTYGRTVFDADGIAPVPAGAPTNSQGEEIYPRGLDVTIREAARIAQVPVYVTENGLSTEDDTQRVEYYRVAIDVVEQCLADGIDLRGYIAWSAMDNFEWIFGYGPKFGVIAVDRATQQRTVKPSGEWLGRVARSNGGALSH